MCVNSRSVFAELHIYCFKNPNKKPMTPHCFRRAELRLTFLNFNGSSWTSLAEEPGTMAQWARRPSTVQVGSGFEPLRSNPGQVKLARVWLGQKINSCCYIAWHWALLGEDKEQLNEEDQCSTIEIPTANQLMYDRGFESMVKWNQWLIKLIRVTS